MIIAFKIILVLMLLVCLVKIIGELCIAFWKPANDDAVAHINEIGLDEYIRNESICDFFRHMFYVFILSSLLFASWNITEEKLNDDNMTKVTITNQK